MFLGPYQPLHRVLKYFLYLSCVQGSSILRGILTMTDFSEATGASGCSSADILSCTGANMDFCLLHNPFRMYLLWCAQNHDHRCSEVYLFPGGHISYFTLEFHPVPYSSIQKSSKVLVNYQSRQQVIEIISVIVGQITRTTAISKSKYNVKQASPMASTRPF